MLFYLFLSILHLIQANKLDETKGMKGTVISHTSKSEKNKGGESYTTEAIKLYTVLSPDPEFTPLQHEHSHVSVKHSASNNSNTDPTLNHDIEFGELQTSHDSLKADTNHSNRDETLQNTTEFGELQISPASAKDESNHSKTDPTVQHPTEFGELQSSSDSANNADDPPEISPEDMHYTSEPPPPNSPDLHAIPEWKEREPLNTDKTTYVERVRRLNFTTVNWTSCEQFLNNSPPLDPQSLIDVDWKIFYFWIHIATDTYHVRFHSPSKTLVDRFKSEAERIYPNATPPILWENAELWMETGIDLSALYLKTETPGLYRFLPSNIIRILFDELEYIPFALKLVEPGYLGIVNCLSRTGFGLAPFDKMPAADEAEEAAASLGFYNEFGRPYTQKASSYVPLPESSFNDDADDDQEIELEHEGELMSIF